MKIEYELVKPDPGSSMRLLHQKVAPSAFVWQYHFHPELELICVVDGGGVRHVGHNMSRYEDGDLILIGSNLPHSGFGLNASDPHEEILIQLPEQVLTTMAANLVEFEAWNNLLERAAYGISFHGRTYGQVKTMMMELPSLPVQDRLIAVFRIFQVLTLSTEYELLNDTVIPSKKLIGAKDRLQKIFTYIEDHYTEEIQIKEVAGLVGLTISSFSAYFKRTTSVSFSTFVNNFRIQKACFLLVNGKNVSETCYACGYNSLSYFTRTFKGIHGKSPREYQRDITRLHSQ